MADVSSFFRDVFRCLIRLALMFMGLVFLLSLMLAAMMWLMLWSLRALWARLTGRTVQPFVFSLLRDAQWQRFYRSSRRQTVEEGEVIDVQARTVVEDAKNARRN